MMQRQDFEKGIRYLCDKLDINYDTIEILCSENQHHEARSKTRHLHISIRDDSEENKQLSAFVKIPISDTLQSFSKHDKIPEYGSDENRCIHWLDTILYEMNLKYKPINLESLFGNNSIRIHKGTRSAFTELMIFLAGIQRLFHDNKLIVYKFQHIDKNMNDYRWFSYAFPIKRGYYPSFWVLFLKAGGLDSNGAKNMLEQYEEKINSVSMPVTYKTFDIEYKDLEQFLKQNSYSFHTPSVLEISFHRYQPNDNSFGNDFSTQYDEFLKIYNDMDYQRALRDLRALVEQALRITQRKFGIEPKEYARVAQMYESLIEKNHVPKHLRQWIDAFTVIANEPAHGRDPNIDLKQIQMIILLGMEIIGTLEESFDDDENDF